MKQTCKNSLQVASIVAGIMACASVAPDANAQSNDALIDALIKKGILTEQEGESIKTDLVKEHQEKTAKDVQFYWKDGLRFKSGDGETFTGKLGGRIMLDAALFSEDSDVEDNIGDQESGTEFRRVRLYTEGEINTSTPTYYKLQLDFADADVAFKDVYLGLSDLPVVGMVQAGHFKEPSSLEQLTSSKYITFMERSTPVEAFTPARNTGVMIGDALFEDKVTWALGAFTSTSMESGDSDGSFDSDARATARLTGIPFQDPDMCGGTLVHLGASGSIINPEDDMVRFRSRPEAHLADRFVDTGNIASDNAYLAGAEAALVMGPFSLQSEYLHTFVDSKNMSDVDFGGVYVYASYFLTGESRAYKASSGTFDRIKPNNNFSLGHGSWGAWELAARYSYLDLNDNGVSGGRLNDITAGVNWYLNPNARVMFNYIFAQVDGDGFDGDMHGVMSRFQVDF